MIFPKPISWIPYGVYCYDELGICPFWDWDKDERIAYCRLLNISDEDENSSGLLFDQCKSCSFNDYEED